MKCTNCGSDMPPKIKYCPKCGCFNFNDDENNKNNNNNEYSSNNSSESYFYDEPAESGKWKIIVALVSILVVIITVFVVTQGKLKNDNPLKEENFAHNNKTEKEQDLSDENSVNNKDDSKLTEDEKQTTSEEHKDKESDKKDDASENNLDKDINKDNKTEDSKEDKKDNQSDSFGISTDDFELKLEYVMAYDDPIWEDAGGDMEYITPCFNFVYKPDPTLKLDIIWDMMRFEVDGEEDTSVELGQYYVSEPDVDNLERDLDNCMYSPMIWVKKGWKEIKVIVADELTWTIHPNEVLNAISTQ